MEESKIIAIAQEAADSEARRIAAQSGVQVDPGDLLGAAWEGAVKGVETYDPAKNVKPEDWVKRKAKYSILDYLRKIAPAGNRRGGCPVSKHSIEAIQEDISDDGMRVDITQDHRWQNPTRELEMLDAIEEFGPRTAKIVKMRAENYMMAEIAEEVGLSESRISQIIAVAMRDIGGLIR